jgi:hypothetical protein
MPKDWEFATLDFTIKMNGGAEAGGCWREDACCKPAGPIRSAPPISMSCRRKAKRLCGVLLATTRKFQIAK